MTPFVRIAIAALGATMLAGCHTDMWVQPKEDPLDQNEFWPDGKSSRPLVAGTVPRGHLREDTAFFTGRGPDGKLVTEIPMQLSAEEMKDLLERGRERFDIYCSPCHSRVGDGYGMIARRGLALRRPPGNYHTERLRNMPIGHFYDVMTNGFGVMFSYSSRVQPRDRWAIAAYIRALQLSQNAPKADYDAAVAAAEREQASGNAGAGGPSAE